MNTTGLSFITSYYSHFKYFRDFHFEFTTMCLRQLMTKLDKSNDNLQIIN